MANFSFIFNANVVLRNKAYYGYRRSVHCQLNANKQTKKSEWIDREMNRDSNNVTVIN